MSRAYHMCVRLSKRCCAGGKKATYNPKQTYVDLRHVLTLTSMDRPVNKFGMPHYSTADDYYGDMFIPKGSVIMLNWWYVYLLPVVSTLLAHTSR